MIIEGLASVVLMVALSDCDVCYPIDPQEPKVVVPANCVLDQEGGLVCNPIDESEKRNHEQ